MPHLDGIVTYVGRAVFAFVIDDKHKHLYAVKDLPGLYRKIPKPKDGEPEPDGLVWLWCNSDDKDKDERGKGILFAAVRDQKVEAEIALLYSYLPPQVPPLPPGSSQTESGEYLVDPDEWPPGYQPTFEQLKRLFELQRSVRLSGGMALRSVWSPKIAEAAEAADSNPDKQATDDGEL
jgi:hypothetical protein